MSGKGKKALIESIASIAFAASGRKRKARRADEREKREMIKKGSQNIIDKKICRDIFLTKMLRMCS
jgi:hypothetical protein